MKYILLTLMLTFWVLDCDAQRRVRGRDFTQSAKDTIGAIIGDSIAFPVDTTALQLLNIIEGRVAYLKQKETGAPGNAVFNGSSSNITIVDDDTLTFSDNSNDSPFSISLWIYADSFIWVPVIMKGSRPGVESEWAIYTDPTSILYFLITDVSLMPGKQVYMGRQCWIGGAGISGYVGVWRNITCTYAGTSDISDIKIYMDGVRIDDNNSSANLADYVAMQGSALDVHIGSNSYRSDYADMKLKDLRIYNKELSSGEVLNIANEKPINSNLVGKWALESNSNDLSGNNLVSIDSNMTYTGSISDINDGGWFVVVDSAYSEDKDDDIAYDHPTSGKQWARVNYLKTKLRLSTGEIIHDLNTSGDSADSDSLTVLMSPGSSSDSTDGWAPLWHPTINDTIWVPYLLNP